MILTLLWCSTSNLYAQPGATPGQSFAWDYGITDLTSYQITRFETRIDSAPFSSIGMPAVQNDPNTIAGHNSYRWPIPAMTPGNHVVSVRACNSTECSDPLDFSFVLVIKPIVPKNLRIVSP